MKIESDFYRQRALAGGWTAARSSDAPDGRAARRYGARVRFDGASAPCEARAPSQLVACRPLSCDDCVAAQALNLIE